MRILNQNNANNGFTLLEILIVLGLIVLLSGGIFLALVNFRKNQQLDLSSREITSVLRDAQSRSINQREGSQWGVRFEDGADRDFYHLFKGSSFSSSVETVSLPSSVELDPAAGPYPKDIVFSKLKGLPDSATSITIRLISDNTVIKTININTQGAIGQ